MLELIIDRVSYWDVRFFSTIFRLNARQLFRRTMHCISRSADGYLYPLIAVCLFFIAPDLAYGFLQAALIAFGIELSVYKLIKAKVRRPRPFDALGDIQNSVVPSDRFSFPSGHTGAAFVMAVLLSSFFPVLALPVYTWATLVGFSRIYLGVHYPTDILAGMVLGSLSASAGIAIAL